MDTQLHTERYKVLASTDESQLCYARGRLWLQDGRHIKRTISLKLSRLAGCRLAERLLRLTPRVGFTIGGEYFFSMQGHLFHVDIVMMEARPIYQFRAGMNNPLSICKCQMDRCELVYWGEYWPNVNHEQVCIFAFDGKQITKVYTLSGVKHVHTVVWDQFRACFWIATGDTDDESRIYRASRQFDQVEIVFSGKQAYRTCTLMPMERGLLYATDSPLCANSLFFSAYADGKFQNPEPIADMPGPCVFGQTVGKNYYFSTSVESNPDQHIVKYWLSSQISPGNIDRKSYVIRVNQELQATTIFCAEKDIYNMAFLQFGTIQLSYDSFTGTLSAYCMALKQYDGQTVYLSVRGD